MAPKPGKPPTNSRASPSASSQAKRSPPPKPPTKPSPPLDPEAVLSESQATLSKMDAMMEHYSNVVDATAVRVAASMGINDVQLPSLAKRQAEVEAEARKAGAADSLVVDGSLLAAGPIVHPITQEQRQLKKKKGWQAPQDEATRSRALTNGAPALSSGLERCWCCFPDLPPAGPDDWLGRGQAGEKDRPGQPLKRFLQPGPHRNFPTRVSKIVYLLPLGGVDGAPAARTLRALLERWLGLEVKSMKPLPAKALSGLARDEDGAGYGPQIETQSAHTVVHAAKPKDAFAVIAYTMEDICDSSKGFGFLFGQADLDRSVGLFSFARYSDGVSTAPPRFLRRCGMVLCHEVGH